MLKYYEEIAYYLQKLTRDKDVAKDLTQDTYVKAIEIVNKSDITLQKAYLYKIARNLVIDKARKDKRTPQTPFDEKEEYTVCESELPEAILHQEARQNTFKRCIENLPTQMQKAFVLHFYEGFSRKEIAEIMGISVGAAEKNITRAIEKIKEAIQKENV